MHSVVRQTDQRKIKLMAMTYRTIGKHYFLWRGDGGVRRKIRELYWRFYGEPPPERIQDFPFQTLSDFLQEFIRRQNDDQV
jgi:hypothetical protein